MTDTTSEHIVPLKDFPGYYVSNTVVVYSVIKQGCRNRLDRTKDVGMHPVSPRFAQNGYARVCLRCRDGKRRDLYIHRLVAEKFVPNPQNKPVVNHKDCVRTNNMATNLEWCTVKENTRYSETSGFMGRDRLGRFRHKLNCIV